MRFGLVITVLGGALMGACTPEVETDTAVELPPEDTFVDDDTSLGTFPVDTSLVLDINEVPTDIMTMRHWGEWNLTPLLGPYTSLSGELNVQEYINDERPDTGIPDTDNPDPDPVILECDVVFSVQGVPADPGFECPTCDFTFRVTYALVSGNADMCSDPDLPAHGDEVTLGFDSTQLAIIMNYKNVGLWTPWYTAEKIGDQVTYQWEVNVGTIVEEEDN